MSTLSLTVLHRDPITRCFHGSLPNKPRQLLNDHLRNALSAECLAALKSLALETRQCVEDGSNQQHNGCSDQAGRVGYEAEPLDEAHYKVYAGAHVVGAKFTDKGVELG
jgi:hypothetical protein